MTTCPHCGMRRPLPGLTKRQAEVLAFIRSYIEARGYSPTYGEISDGAGLNSKGRAHAIVEELIERGRLVSDRYRVRSLRVVEG